MGYIAVNNAYSTLATGLTATDTSIVVQPGHGARFDVGADYTYATLENSSGAVEIVKVIARSGDTLTVVRGQDGTNATTWNAGDVIDVRPCRAAFNDIMATKQDASANLDKYAAVNPTAAGLALLDDADATAQLATLGAAPLTGATFTGLVNFAAGADIASAATIDLTAATGNIVRVTGTTPTTNVIINPGQRIICYAVGAWPLVHHPINLPLPGSRNYTCVAGDAVIISKDRNGDKHIEIVKKDGTAVVVPEVGTGTAGLFYKADPMTVVFVKTGLDTASIKAGTKIEVAGTVVTFDTVTPIIMPTLVAGTDYAIWVKDDSTIQATSNFSSPPSAGNWRKIGGFHYAPGGNAPAQAGGDTIPTINEYSFWDLKFRPACSDPRGMTLVADSFWADIYLLGVDHLINGTSKYNATIADGSSPPKIPIKFGGNGSATYSNMNWWVASEVLRSHGKRPPTYDEFAALAYGTTEAAWSGGTDVPTTGVNGTGATNTWNKFTSRWGVIQSSGCMYVWGAEFGGGNAGANWSSSTGGRGSTYQMENVAVFGGAWNDFFGASGSRCSRWDASPSGSQNNIGARGVADHVIIY